MKRHRKKWKQGAALGILLITALAGCARAENLQSDRTNQTSEVTEQENENVTDGEEIGTVEHSLNSDTMENVIPEDYIADVVDLGLSVKWASFNLGASSPEEYGGLYGWGDVTGTLTSENYDDYPNKNPPSRISGTEYDIAAAKWGDEWRLPTTEEFEELINNCTWEEITANDVKGFQATGPNGNTVFFPNCGGRIADRAMYQVSGADYWSGDLDENDTDKAFCLTFWQGDMYTGSLPRYYGFGIRPVTE